MEIKVMMNPSWGTKKMFKGLQRCSMPGRKSGRRDWRCEQEVSSAIVIDNRYPPWLYAIFFSPTLSHFLLPGSRQARALRHCHPLPPLSLLLNLPAKRGTSQLPANNLNEDRQPNRYTTNLTCFHDFHNRFNPS